MASGGSLTELMPESRRNCIPTWFDIEIAAVVTILLGLFQLLLCSTLIQIDLILPKLFFILPLVLGIIIIAGGSLTVASQKNPSKLLRRSCAWSNVLGLLGSLAGLCVYSYTLIIAENKEPCPSNHDSYYGLCPQDLLAVYTWSITLQLLLYDMVTVVMHLVLSYICFHKTD